jgi:hypothetical protein
MQSEKVGGCVKQARDLRFWESLLVDAETERN